MREFACPSFAASSRSLVHGARVSLDALDGQKWRGRVAGTRRRRHEFRKRRSDGLVVLQHDSLTTTFHAPLHPSDPGRNAATRCFRIPRSDRSTTRLVRLVSRVEEVWEEAWTPRTCSPSSSVEEEEA